MILTADILGRIHATAFYVVMNSNGHFFRSVGYPARHDTCWVGELEKARVYQKLSLARSRVSFFAIHYPDYAPPSIIKIVPGIAEILDETARVQKVLVRRKNYKEKHELRNKAMALKAAERDYEDAKNRLTSLSQ